MSGRIRANKAACENLTSGLKTVRNAGVQKRRLQRALALMLCCSLALVMPCALAQMTDEVGLKAPYATFNAATQAVEAIADPVGAPASAQRFVNGVVAPSPLGGQAPLGREGVSVDELPDDLSEEISLPEKVGDCLVDARSRIIGYRTSEAPDEALANLRESMASAGWRAMAAEGFAGMSLEKGEGALRWAFATAAQDDDGAFVVLRLMG